MRSRCIRYWLLADNITTDLGVQINVIGKSRQPVGSQHWTQLRVFSPQNIESELEAVELQAWQDLLRVLAHEMMNSLTPRHPVGAIFTLSIPPTAAGESR